MSAPPECSRHPVSFTPSPLDGMFLNEGVMVPRNYEHGLHLRMPNPTMPLSLSRPPLDNHSSNWENNQPLIRESSITDVPRSYDILHSWSGDQINYDTGFPTSAHRANIQMPFDARLWNPSDVQQVPQEAPALCTPSTANEGHADPIVMGSYPSAYDLCPNAEHSDSRYTTSWPTSPDLQRFIDQESATRPHAPNESNARLYSACSSPAGYHLRPGPSVPQRSLQYRPFNPTLLCSSPHSTLAESFVTASHSHHVFHRVPQPNSTASSRRRRAGRVIEFNGLLIDEEELRKSLRNPGGRLIIHPCRWDEDHSPCHLWIPIEKSCINRHIQRWHGERPGGDKLQANCRWTACGKKILKESITRHVIAIHLKEKFGCQGCGKDLPRKDAYGRHVAESDLEACRTSGALITYSADALEVDARAALEGGRRIQNAGA